MGGVVQELTIGRHRYVFGMDWYILEAEDLRHQIDDISVKHQTKIGVRTGNAKTNPGVGFLHGMKATGVCSAAASLARQLDNSIVVHPMKALGGPPDLFWLVAIQDKRVMPGSDAVLPADEIVPLVRRFRVLGEFNLVGNEDFFRDNFKDMVEGEDYFIQTSITLSNMLNRHPVRVRPIARQRRKHIAIALTAVAVIAMITVGYALWQKKKQQEQFQQIEQPTSVETWRAQLPLARAQMIRDFHQRLGDVTPARFADSVLARIGRIEPIIDDWFLSEIRCTRDSCITTWVNNGLSNNEFLWRELRKAGTLTFDVSGKQATLELPLTIEADREERSSVEIAALPKQQEWLRVHGSRLQELQAAGIQVQLSEAVPSAQFTVSPDGTALIGPDTTFKHGRFRIQGRHYFMIRDAVKRLTADYFAIEILQVRFNNRQESQGWTLEGNYVWK